MSQFKEYTGVKEGTTESRSMYFNHGRMFDIVTDGATGCIFKYRTFGNAIDTWTVTASYATVIAEAAAYESGSKIPFTFIKKNNLANTSTEGIDVDKIVYVKNNTAVIASSSIFYMDKGIDGLRDELVINRLYATVLTDLNATGTGNTAATVAQLITGTSSLVYVAPKTLKDAGITFAATTILAIAGGTANQLAITTTGGAQGFTVTSTAQTANDLCSITTTSAVTSAALIKAFDVSMQMTAASANNMVEAARFTLTSNVKLGQWANAICGKIDLGDNGYATGLAGVVCAELQLPTAGVAGGSGTYTCFEAEIGMDGVSNGVPVSAMAINVWGAQVADFDTNGFIFDISGVTKGSGKVFQDNGALASTQALRCRINGVAHYIMLTSVGA